MKRNVLACLALLVASFIVSCSNNSGSGGDGDSTSNTTENITTDTAGGTTPYTSSADRAGSSPIQGQDSTFALEAASAGMMEVALGQMAQQKATNPRVRSFGEMMVRDHSKANEELKSLVAAKNLALPDSMMKKHRDHVTSMQQMSGNTFDQHYMEMMVKDHGEDVQKFERASNSAADADLKGWAGKTLPVLRMHLDSARAISSANR